MPTTTPHVVLVHGGFVDGSGWQGVYDRLTKDSHTVTVVQNATISLDGDVATTKQALHAHEGPAILVGHSYGGAVITEAGDHPAVKALVYIAAFAPDKGESVNTLIADPPPGAPVPPILPPRDGFLFLDRDKFAASFAGDTVSCPAWRAKPSWYLVTTDDRMIPPPAQRAMCERIGATTVEVAASHAVYLSQPDAVAALISAAAEATTSS
jgi:pimeloyl-ACP methyl ester carboxylesterase